MLLPLLALAAAASAAEPSLLKDRPTSGLLDEVVELRPAAGHHFNVEAPQKCGGEKPLEVLPRRVRCQLKSAGKFPVLVSVCDDAKTFCRQESFDISVRGASGAKASPMTAAPKGGRKAPEGFVDNDPAAAQALARKDGKLLFIDFYGIWCPPCNDLEEHAYPAPEFKAAAKDFVLVGLDADTPGSHDWKSRFKVGGYPTLVIADADLREVARVIGYRSGPALAEVMRTAVALRGEPIEAAAAAVAKGGAGATEARRVRVARWRSDRAEFERAEDLLKGLASAEARKLALETRRERARVTEDAEAGLAALRGLLDGFPDDASYSDWASALADQDAAAAKALEPALRRSVERWSAEPALGAAGYDPGDLLYNLASFLDAIGSTEAAKDVWTKVADAYAAQAAASPLAVPRAANFGRAEALWKAGRKDEAKALYETLVKAYPGEFTFNYDYATALADEDPRAAYPYAVKAVAAAYGDNWLRAVRLKASLELALGRAADAARTVDEALAQTVPPKSSAVRTFRYVTALRDLRRKIAAAKK
ncbi:MAG: thioredoxin family protein [Elusimicrobia bacterium]|nr:thioredoxin family protein [Elusimicrobiota bacterium]